MNILINKILKKKNKILNINTLSSKTRIFKIQLINNFPNLNNIIITSRNTK